MSHYPAISWYGKLPSAGDFLQRRFPDALQRQWSHWFQVGLLNWQKEDEQRETGNRQFSSARSGTLWFPRCSAVSRCRWAA